MRAARLSSLIPVAERSVTAVSRSTLRLRPRPASAPPPSGNAGSTDYGPRGCTVGPRTCAPAHLHLSHYLNYSLLITALLPAGWAPPLRPRDRYERPGWGSRSWAVQNGTVGDAFFSAPQAESFFHFWPEMPFSFKSHSGQCSVVSGSHRHRSQTQSGQDTHETFSCFALIEERVHV